MDIGATAIKKCPFQDRVIEYVSLSKAGFLLASQCPLRSTAIPPHEYCIVTALRMASTAEESGPAVGLDAKPFDPIAHCCPDCGEPQGARRKIVEVDTVMLNPGHDRWPDCRGFV